MATVASRANAAQGMRGSDRVAAILLTMGKSLSTRLMKHFEPAEIRQITRSATDLKPVAAQQLGSLIEDFATQFAIGASLVSSPAEVQRMLDGVLPQEQIDEIMGDVEGRPDHHSIWERISAVNENSLAQYLTREHPQTAAVVLANIKSATAAKVLARLPAERRDMVIRRMIAARPMVEDATRLLERTLHQEFSASLSGSSGSAGQERLAEIINKLEPEQIDSILGNLAATQPKAAEALKNQLFTFEDIGKLSQRARSTLFEKVPTDNLVTALKGSATEFRELILSALSSRVRKMIEQELNNGQPVPARNVAEMRRAITDTALELAARGEIEIRTEDDEELVS